MACGLKERNSYGLDGAISSLEIAKLTAEMAKISKINDMAKSIDFLLLLLLMLLLFVFFVPTPAGQPA